MKIIAFLRHIFFGTDFILYRMTHTHDFKLKKVFYTASGRPYVKSKRFKAYITFDDTHFYKWVFKSRGK